MSNVQRVWKLIEVFKTSADDDYETTSAMEVPGGCLVRVKAVWPPEKGYKAAIALQFVPFACLVPAPGGMYRFESTMAGTMSSIMGAAKDAAVKGGAKW